MDPCLPDSSKNWASVAEAVRTGAASRPHAAPDVKAPLVAKDAKIGDSIAVNGCCLTVVKKAEQPAVVRRRQRNAQPHEPSAG